MARRDGDQRRLGGAADLLDQGAAIGEHAAGQVGADLRQEPRDRVEPSMVLACARPRDAAQQAHRVRVPRIAQHLLGQALLHEAAGVEHADAVAHPRDHAEVVADEEHRRVQLGLQRLDQVEHLGLDRGVEPRGRLVEDQQGRVVCERHRDHDALLHAARELVREALHDGAAIRDLHLGEHRARALVGLAAPDAAGV